MTLREVLLIAHITGALAVAAGAGTALLSTLAAGRSPDLATMARSARLQVLGGRVAAFSMIMVLVFGTWLVIESAWIEFSDAWVSAAYALWFVTMGIGGGMVDRQASRVARLAGTAIERGEAASTEAAAAWTAPVGRIGQAALVVSLVVFLYLMVSKPGA